MTAGSTARASDRVLCTHHAPVAPEGELLKAVGPGTERWVWRVARGRRFLPVVRHEALDPGPGLLVPFQSQVIDEEPRRREAFGRLFR